MTTKSGVGPDGIEVITQRVSHGPEGLEYVRIIGLAADDKEHVRLL